VVILYQVLTEHVARFHRWASLKANLILNCLEIIFWAVVGGMSMQSLNRFCGDGAVCAVGWINGVLAFVLWYDMTLPNSCNAPLTFTIKSSFMAIYVSVLSYKEFKEGKRAGLDGSYRPSSVPLQKGGHGRSEV
jgi:hypothetical protein